MKEWRCRVEMEVGRRARDVSERVRERGRVEAGDGSEREGGEET